MAKIQAIRGMKDILPNEIDLWQWCEEKIRLVTRRYCYHEIRLPVLEPVMLFQRAVGQSTDIVSKEMYDFLDKSGEHITLRPEGTSGCVRAIIEHNLCYRKNQRLWYFGPMFRYERPQKGRLRQFTQFGAETFGMSGAEIDAELILLVRDLFFELGVLDQLKLQINSLGTPEERTEYRKALIEYLIQHKSLLDEDSLNRLSSNPLRILDSKNPEMQEMINQSPSLLDYLTEESSRHFTQLCDILKLAGIQYEINHRLVRGLDYYSRTVFEWVTDTLGAQGTVCGGGRYDGLVELFDKNSLPASGFAIGMERLILLIKTVNPELAFTSSPDIIVVSEHRDSNSMLILQQLRTALPWLKILADYSDSKVKKQHINAIKTGCKYIITIKDNNQLDIWHLDSRDHHLMPLPDIIALVKQKLADVSAG